MLTRAIAEKALSVALQSGADFAELYLEDCRSTNLRLVDRKVDDLTTGRRYGAGIRLFLGTKTVYAYTNDCSEAGLCKAAETAAGVLGAALGEKPVCLQTSVARNLSPIAVLPMDVEARRKAQVLKALDAGARERYAEISQVHAGLWERDKKVWIANTEGLFVEDRRVLCRATVQAVASSGMENQTGYCNHGASRGFEFIEGLDAVGMGREAAEQASAMLRARDCPPGVMPVVIANGFGGVIFHEACGHSLEATSVGRGNSVFCGKLGQKVASPIVSAVDDGTLPNEWGTLNLDDEGMPTQRNQLIRSGVLTSYMIDRLGARRMGLPRTGSGRRQDYAYAPTSRMTNTYICPGNDEDEEIIATCGDGLFCKSLGGGSVNPVTGEFNFAVREGYRIRAGKIDEPLRGATLIGKGSEILWKIDRVGRDMQMAQGMCGSLSGSVPTNVGQPMIRVSEITVGGKE